MDGPLGTAHEDTAEFQAEVPVEVGGVVFVDDEVGRIDP
jgi:hypothetical protein